MAGGVSSVMLNCSDYLRRVWQAGAEGSLVLPLLSSLELVSLHLNPRSRLGSAIRSVECFPGATWTVLPLTPAFAKPSVALSTLVSEEIQAQLDTRVQTWLFSSDK